HKTTGTVTMTGGTINCTDRITLGEGTDSSFPGVSGNGTINVQGGTLTVKNAISVGTSSKGALNISGGSVTAGSVAVTGNGTMNLSNGTLAAPVTSAGTTQISGGTLSNSLTVTGSKTTWSGGTITGAINVNSGGTLTLGQGTTSISSATGEQVLTVNGGTVNYGGSATRPILAIGNGGKGKVVLNSGTIAYSNDVNLGQNAADIGTIEMNGGKFTSNSFNVGRSGTGNLNIAAGSFSTGYYLSIADQPGSTGNVTVSGGTATAGNTLSVGNRGTGTYTQTGGMVTAGQVQVGQSHANAQGDLNISAGVLKSNGTLKIGGTGTGTMELSGSASVSANTLENAQNLTWTGGDLYLGTSATGNLTQNGGTLYVGDQVNTQTLTWTRKTNNAFPGARDAQIKDKSDATIADFWAKAKTTETDYPQSGVTTPSTIAVGSASIANYLPQNLGLDYFTIVYEGKISIDSEGDYKFNFKGDDGGFLYVDGECVAHMTLLDYGDPWGRPSISTAIHLTPGLHDFTMQYYDGYGGNNLTEMNMQKLGDGGAVVSTTNLLDASAPFATVVQNYKNVKVTGDYTQGENAEIVMGIDAANGAHDSLEITGQADFNGALTVNIENDPTFMSDVQIFNVPNANYNFSEITINSMFPQSVWNLDGLMAGGDGFIRIDRGAVPEPTTWVLLLAGLSGLFMISRRKNGKKRLG
nr:PEP-CTERM sorting domain-containing protein [Thermoguttaceae bacterium]